MNQSSAGMRLLAPAKINLGLEVLRRRSDGFHDINTIFAAIDLYDELLLRPRFDRRIVCTVEGNEQLESDERNLCVRAVSALHEVLSEETPGLEIHLSKHIPIGAGLGGGSSDAASVLLGAARLWDIDVSRQILADIALSLGSDVPYFLHGGLAHATSRGEVLTPIDLHLPYTVLLINPGIYIPTPWAYRALGRVDERPASDLVELIRSAASDPWLLRNALYNDFEAAVFGEYPLLPQIKANLYNAGALYAAMSGSGSTMFGLFPDRESARVASAHFAQHWTAVAAFSSMTPPIVAHEEQGQAH